MAMVVVAPAASRTSEMLDATRAVSLSASVTLREISRVAAPCSSTADEMVVDASLGVRELADDYDVVLPRGAGYETLAGFVLARLGLVPKGGETFVFGGLRYTVTEMDGRRVARVRIERPPTRGAAVQVAGEGGTPQGPSA